MEGKKRTGTIRANELTDVGNGQLLYLPGFYTEEECGRYFRELRTETEWAQEAMQIYGRKVSLPRLTAWYGDKDQSYSFSGIRLQPKAWLPVLTGIRHKLETAAGTTFNSVLLNLYRDGNDSISWHTDAEPELGVNPIIGSVNFGQPRLFQLRHKETKEKIEIELGNGSALIMLGELQHFWQHQVPKTAKPMKERINLTFRYIRRS